MRSSSTFSLTAPVRGHVIAVTTSDTGKGLVESFVQAVLTWALPPEQRAVDVLTTASASALPRFYRNVPWNGLNGSNPAVSVSMPKLGDQVMLGFSGGHPDFPYVLAHYPGGATQDAVTSAEAPLAATPSTVQALAFSLPTPSAATTALYPSPLFP